MSNCKHFKTRTKTINKKKIIYNYCTLLRKEVSFSCYQECNKKEYKQYKQLQAKNEYKMKSKTSKLAKLERNRFSVFTNNENKCMFCPSTKGLTWHEIYSGRNRQNSMKYGFCLRMCLMCHESKQEDKVFNDSWHKRAQEYFENNIGSRDEFVKIFRKNWIKKDQD